MNSPVRGRTRRRWPWLVVAGLFLGVTLIIALPWLLALPVAKRGMAAAANKILAPGSVEFSAVRVSWFRPTEILDCALHDAHGDRVVAASRAHLSWNLWQILIARPKQATLTLEGTNVDIERSADGTIDLYETLRPVISERPPVRLVIRIGQGRLRFRDPAFTDPVVADKADIVLDLGREIEPITWKIQLEQTPKTGDAPRIAIDGTYSRAVIDQAGRHDLALTLVAARWPWTFANQIVQARGELSGKASNEVRSGRVRIEGDATVTNLVAIGDAFSSDTVHLDRARVQLALDRSDEIWNIKKLDVASPIISVNGQGLIPPTPEKGARFEATLDLAAVSHQLPATLHLRDELRIERGTARLAADVRSGTEPGAEIWSVDGKVTDLAARLGEKSLTLSEPATLVAKLDHRDKQTELERFEVQTSFLSATGQGNLDRGIVVTASLDLAAFRDRFHDWVDFGQVELAGHGQIEARYQRQDKSFRAGVNMVFRDLHVDGLPLVDKWQREELTVDAKVAGPITAGGLPQSWTEFSLSGLSGVTNLSVSANVGTSHDEVTVLGRASTSLSLADKIHAAHAELTAKWRNDKLTADRIALRLIPRLPQGPGAAPEKSIRWEGKGLYDRGRDLLTLESLAPHPPTKDETWITGDQKLIASDLSSNGAAQVEVAADADLAAIGDVLSANEFPWAGRMKALVRARRDKDLWDLGLRVELNNAQRFAADGSKVSLPERVLFTANGGYAPRLDRIDISELAVKSKYLVVDGRGSVDHLTTQANVDFKGSLNPNWPAIQSLLAEKIEPNARISGRPRPWRLAGHPNGLPAVDRMGSLEGELGVQIDSLDVFGMRLTTCPVVLRSAAGRLSVDAIDSTLNGGVLHLEPELVRAKDGSTWLHLGQASHLDEAIVNDEVSHRVLAFAAPVLDGATRVEGRVSLSLTEAYFPVVAAADARPSIEGDLQFHDVRFMPGPLAVELLSAFQAERRPLAVLRDPINVRIAGRKVYQEGLSIPVGNIAAIGVNGSVDFDQNLDLVARFSLTPSGRRVPVLTPVMENVKFELPITGTLRKPKIDAEALKERWKATANDLLGDSVQVGVAGLQQLLQRLSVPGRRALGAPVRRIPPPPVPGVDQPGPGDRPAADDPDLRKANREVQKPLPPDERRGAATPFERQQLREQRRRERLQKKADRRAQRAPG